MKWFKRYFLDWPVPLYVLLLAVFPVLFLYAYNIAEMKFGQALLPLGVSIGGAVLLWILLTLILRDARKAGLATALFLFFFFSYGRLYELLENWDVFVPKHAYLLPGMLLFWGYCVYFIDRAKRGFRTTTTVLNIVVAVLIIINIANISIYQITKPKVAPDEPAEATGAAAPASGIPESLPDIYFIILDEYAHPETMKEWYDYDNSRFINSLEDKGFFIVNRSKTRSEATPEAIAQVLNMEYLTPGRHWDSEKKKYVEIVAAEGDYPGDIPWSEPTYQKIGYNKVVDFLKSKGYKFIYFGNFQAHGRYEQSIKDNTDLYVNCYASDGGSIVNEFQHTLWKTSMLRPFYHYITGRQCESHYRRGVLNQLEHLKKVPDMESPKLVFAHFMCPHEPFAFGPSGEFIAPVNYDTYEDKQFYLGQYIFISAEIEKVVDELLARSKTPPIIILQSDHGLRPHHPGIVIGSGEWQKILNAMYLPRIDKTVLYERMSPVNTFRLVFNHYFGADYELLEDD